MSGIVQHVLLPPSPASLGEILDRRPEVLPESLERALKHCDQRSSANFHRHIQHGPEAVQIDSL